MLKALVSTMLDAHDQRYIEDHNRFRTIKIPTLGISTTQFNLSKEESRSLYDSGFMAATAFINKWSASAYEQQFKKLVYQPPAT
jgi:NTE family protein